MISHLQANNVTITSDGKIIWDVSGYTQYDNFVITLGRGAATRTSGAKLLMKSMAKANASGSEKMEWTVLLTSDDDGIEGNGYVIITEPVIYEDNSNDGSNQTLPSEEPTKSVEAVENETAPVVEENTKTNVLSSIISKVESGDIDEEKVNSIVNEPVVEDKKEEPVVEDKKEEPVVEDKVVEDKKEEPVVEDKKEEPVVEDKKAEPVVEDKKAEPVVEDKKAEPVVEDKKEEAKSAETKLEEKVEISEPVIELTVEPTELVTVNTIAE